MLSAGTHSECWDLQGRDSSVTTTVLGGGTRDRQASAKCATSGAVSARVRMFRYAFNAEIPSPRSAQRLPRAPALLHVSIAAAPIVVVVGALAEELVGVLTERSGSPSGPRTGNEPRIVGG